MLLVGFTTSLPFTSISDWFLTATIPLAVMTVPPVLYFSGVWTTGLAYLVPTQGALLLFGSAFNQVSLASWQIVYAVAYPLTWVVALWCLARRMFTRYVIAQSGGM
jgi:fluoroquinolone transport system permease protein